MLLPVLVDKLLHLDPLTGEYYSTWYIEQYMYMYAIPHTVPSHPLIPTYLLPQASLNVYVLYTETHTHY